MNRHRWMRLPSRGTPDRSECSQSGRKRQRGESDEPGSPGDVPESHAAPAWASGQADVCVVRPRWSTSLAGASREESHSAASLPRTMAAVLRVLASTHVGAHTVAVRQLPLAQRSCSGVDQVMLLRAVVHPSARRRGRRRHPTTADLDELPVLAFAFGHRDQERLPLGTDNGYVTADLDECPSGDGRGHARCCPVRGPRLRRCPQVQGMTGRDRDQTKVGVEEDLLPASGRE